MLSPSACIPRIKYNYICRVIEPDQKKKKKQPPWPALKSEPVKEIRLALKLEPKGKKQNKTKKRSNKHTLALNPEPNLLLTN